MFVSRPQVVHGQDYRITPLNRMSDQRVKGSANIVASNIQTLTTHTSDVTSLAFSNTTLATCSSDKTVRLWSAKDFTEEACSPLMGHSYMIHCCAFSPLGSVLATCSVDGTLKLWDTKTGEILASLSHPGKCSLRVCQFSPNGSMLVTGGDDDMACLWNVAERRLIRTLKGHDESVAAAAFSPDNNYVVTGSSGGDLCGDLMVWDAQFGHGKYLHRVPDCHDLGVMCIQFSPTYGSASNLAASSVSSFLLATGGKDNLVKLWHFNCEVGSVNVSIKLDTMLPGHSDSILWLAFSPNGKFIASCSLDRTVRLWNAFSKQAMITIDGHSSYVTFCAFSTNNKYLATASSDKTVKIWQLTDTSNIMNGLSGYEAGEEVASSSENSGLSKVAMETWGVEDVCSWLRSLGLEQYEEVFRSNAIDGRELLALSPDDLSSSLGIAALGHKNKILRARAALQQLPISSKKSEPLGTPEEFLCPISQEIMRDPVLASDGYTYDRPAILAWMAKGDQRSPMTNLVLASRELTPNRTLKMMIQKFLQEPK